MQIEITILDGRIYTRNPVSKKLHRHKQFESSEEAQEYVTTFEGHQAILNLHEAMVHRQSGIDILKQYEAPVSKADVELSFVDALSAFNKQAVFLKIDEMTYVRFTPVELVDKRDEIVHIAVHNYSHLYSGYVSAEFARNMFAALIRHGFAAF